MNLSAFRNVVLMALCMWSVQYCGVAAGVINVPGDHDTIQAAINAAVDTGDEIAVGPGTYAESIDFGGKAVRLYSSGGPDATTINGNGAFHVVKCATREGADTVLEGFTITGGNANDYFPDNAGGGMYNYGSSPTVKNCVFTGNNASSGAGMYNGRGSPSVSDCVFTENSAEGYGGGMRNYRSSATLVNCVFEDNSAESGGGGLHNNNADPNGGNLTLTGCVISDNTCDSKGGGIFNNQASPILTNCTFANNTATAGGALYDNTLSSPTITNCILWGNTPDEILDDTNSKPTVNFSDVEGGWSGAGGDNKNEDPMFANADDGDFRLKPGPCIDTGDNNAVTVATDLDGNPRVADGNGDGNAVVDMGAYEAEPAGCVCIGDLNDDGWISPADVSAVVTQLLPYATNAYWKQAEAGHCGETNGDGWLSPSDVSGIVTRLLPYRTNAYWLQCPQ